MLNPLWIPSQPNLAPVIGSTRSITVSQSVADPAITLSITPSIAHGAEYNWYKDSALHASTSQSTYVYYPDEGDYSAHNWHVVLSNSYGSSTSDAAVGVYSWYWYYEKYAPVIAVINALTAAGATVTSAHKDAITTFILNGVNNGWWSKMIGLYGMYGNAASTAVNWKSPGTYNITWTGSQPTCSSTGVSTTGGQSNFSGNTHISTALFTDNGAFHVSVYHQSTSLSDFQPVGTAGAPFDDTPQLCLWGTLANKLTFSAFAHNGIPLYSGTAKGLWLGVRRSDGYKQLYLNGKALAPASSAGGGSPYIGNVMFFRSRLGRQTAAGHIFSFASVGYALSETEAADFNTDVLALMSALGRNNL